MEKLIPPKGVCSSNTVLLRHFPQEATQWVPNSSIVSMSQCRLGSFITLFNFYHMTKFLAHCIAFLASGHANLWVQCNAMRQRKQNDTRCEGTRRNWNHLDCLASTAVTDFVLLKPHEQANPSCASALLSTVLPGAQSLPCDATPHDPASPAPNPSSTVPAVA